MAKQLSILTYILSLQAKSKRDLASVINKQEIERDIETKKVRTLFPSLPYSITVTHSQLLQPCVGFNKVKRREACMEFELFATQAHIQELKVSLKQQSAEHVVAQHETKKNLR